MYIHNLHTGIYLDIYDFLCLGYVQLFLESKRFEVYYPLIKGLISRQYNQIITSEYEYEYQV